MDFITDLLSNVGSLNIEVIAQLTVLVLIVLAGPIVIVLLAAQGGDL